MIPQSYDIFSGSPEKEPLWLESVSGLAPASQRMNELARTTPGAYFVFCVHTKEVLEAIDTSAPARSSSFSGDNQRRTQKA